MQPVAQRFFMSDPGSSEGTCIKTTLYELIEAASDEIRPHEERWLALILYHMLRFGRSISL